MAERDILIKLQAKVSRPRPRGLVMTGKIAARWRDGVLVSIRATGLSALAVPGLFLCCLVLPGAGQAATRKPAAPMALPALSVEKTCRQAVERQGPGLDTYEACIRDEAAARDKLSAGLWKRAAAGTRTTCLANQTIGGLASYIDLLTCVEMFEGVVIQPADRPQP
jgi:hypothetical protein